MARLSKLDRSVQDRVVLITGAASGMGRAAAHLFADEGAKVGLLDRDAESLLAVVDEITGAGGQAVGEAADVQDGSSVARAVEAIRSKLGPIDILVNNAGVSLPSPIDAENYDEAWDTTLGVNLKAQSVLVRLCLDDLTRNQQGRIVNIASTEGLDASPFATAYTASKHGVIGLTKGLAVELGRRGVTVNCVCPGPIRTGMTAAIPDEHKDKFARRRVPIGRYGDPEEVAQAILSLALPASSYVNGAVLVVDGGMTAQNT